MFRTILAALIGVIFTLCLFAGYDAVQNDMGLFPIFFGFVAGLCVLALAFLAEPAND